MIISPPAAQKLLFLPVTTALAEQTFVQSTRGKESKIYDDDLQTLEPYRNSYIAPSNCTFMMSVFVNVLNMSTKGFFLDRL